MGNRSQKNAENGYNYTNSWKQYFINPGKEKIETISAIFFIRYTIIPYKEYKIKSLETLFRETLKFYINKEGNSKLT